MMSESPSGSKGKQKSSNPITAGAEGFYFYVNPRTTAMDHNLQRLLTQVSAAGVVVSTAQSEYDWACTQVRTAGGNAGYACGSVIGPGFFDTDKMLYTINYVMLKITRRQESSMGASSAIKAKSGITPVATHGFVVLRDLTRVSNGIIQAITHRERQEAYPGSDYFEGLRAHLIDSIMLVSN